MLARNVVAGNQLCANDAVSDSDAASRGVSGADARAEFSVARVRFVADGEETVRAQRGG